MKLFGANPNAALNASIVHEAATRAIAEDVGPADITSLATVPQDTVAHAQIVAREPGRLAGLPVAAAVFRELDPAIAIDSALCDGDSFGAGAVILELAGNARAILAAERSALNFLQQLSGVATKTTAFVAAVAGTKTKILDTRKTIPGLRALQKYAVACGGGANHRMGLYDMFLFKDNHLALMENPGDLAAAIAAARRLSPESKIEVEADTVDQVRQIIALDVDYILLDNMSLDEMAACVKLIAGKALVEASGNMTLDRVALVAQTGVDFISIGGLTHSTTAVDLSLELA
jgi:nicotinate-nucleotide pyrophosphorylase (carboxylating)